MLNNSVLSKKFLLEDDKKINDIVIVVFEVRIL